MKTIFSNPDPIAVRSLAVFLEQRGIQVTVAGEDRLSAAGGLAPTECWPEIKLIREEQEQEAIELIREYDAGTQAKPSWICETCGEQIEGQFTECWKCSNVEPVCKGNIVSSHSRLTFWFRTLLAIEALLFVLLPKLAEYSFYQLPSEIQDFVYASHVIPRFTSDEVSLIFTVASIIGLIGMFFLLNFARYLTAGIWIFLLVWTLIASSHVVITSIEMTLWTLSTLMGATVLYLAFFSKLAIRFKRKQSN